MRKMKYIIGILLLFMVIGFATVTVSLSLSGNVKVVSDIDDFKVYFSEAKLNGTSTPALIESATSLSFDVDFGNLGSQHVIEYDVTNASKLFDAAISMSCTQSNEYLSVVNEFDTSNLSALSTRTGSLTLTKTKSNASETNTDYAITCEIVASPVERDGEAVGEIPNAMVQNYAILKSTTTSDTTAFRSATYKTKIKTITFEDKINVPETAIESWDIGVSENGNVMAYVIANANDSTYYDLYIQSDTQLYANKNMAHWFNGLTYVDSINGLELLDTSLTTNMTGMFYDTGKQSTVFTLDDINFDTSNVTNMNGMFYQTGYNNSTFALDVSSFDTSNVTNMASMFYATGYKSTTFTLDVSNFDTSNVTTMEGMFYQTGYNSTTFTLDVSEFNTSKVTDMTAMFGSSGYKSTVYTLDVSNFDTSNVTEFDLMFSSVGRSNPTFTLDVSNFDTSNAINMENMFNCTGYNSTVLTLDVSNFDTSNVTNMRSMFAYAGRSNPTFTLDVSNFETSKVTNMQSMFNETGCNSTVFTLDVSNFDTSEVTTMSHMFYKTGYNSTVFTLDVSNFDTSNVTNMSQMFSETGYNSTVFTLDVSNFDTSNVTNMSNMFNKTGYNSTVFTLDVSNFDTSNVTNMRSMFYQTGYNSTKFNSSITIRNPNTTSYSNMFTYVATKTGSKITVNYTSVTSDLVDEMIATKSSTSNVVKGYNESSVISFTIDGTTYNAYEGMTWGQWADSEYNTDGIFVNSDDIVFKGTMAVGSTYGSEKISSGASYYLEASPY